ncbi:hypothetical protein KIN20_025166 [Parelaphostrongylus tenuis]|uniref:Uncharacterized protein n=1 Tax=Parelaphostrongylus tenuis TaxID=148309 RepID=A0AAD5MUT5_PARTN|nr:hypothetical protein KIN20_025166 [Parelaphostrongylus tenuis]
MTFSSAAGAAAQVAGISTSANAARAFVNRAVMQAVFNVLEQQGRAAGLPDFIISSILNQLTVNINYAPLECKDVVVNHPNPAADIRTTMDTRPKCIIFGTTVTALCNKDMCKLDGSEQNKLADTIPSTHLTISGTLMTTNIIMSNWSRQMWQSVVNRVLRATASRPFGLHFFSAVATVS